MKNAILTIATTALLTANLSADDLNTTTAPEANVHTGWYIGLGAGASL